MVLPAMQFVQELLTHQVSTFRVISIVLYSMSELFWLRIECTGPRQVALPLLVEGILS